MPLFSIISCSFYNLTLFGKWIPRACNCLANALVTSTFNSNINGSPIFLEFAMNVVTTI